MPQDMSGITQFTPVASLFGGALIGLSAVLLMWQNGRIAGVSGIAVRLFPPYTDQELPGRVAMIAGLVAAPLACGLVTSASPVPTITSSLPLLVVAGLVVGFGSVWGLAGVCPGPAFTAPTSGLPAVLFIAAMLVVMLAARTLASRPAAPAMTPLFGRQMACSHN
jgi:uncharacterized membrane protein YedE/YeeE